MPRSTRTLQRRPRAGAGYFVAAHRLEQAVTVEVAVHRRPSAPTGRPTPRCDRRAGQPQRRARFVVGANTHVVGWPGPAMAHSSLKWSSLRARDPEAEAGVPPVLGVGDLGDPDPSRGSTPRPCRRRPRWRWRWASRRRSLHRRRDGSRPSCRSARARPTPTAARGDTAPIRAGLAPSTSSSAPSTFACGDPFASSPGTRMSLFGPERIPVGRTSGDRRVKPSRALRLTDLVGPGDTLPGPPWLTT